MTMTMMMTYSYIQLHHLPALSECAVLWVKQHLTVDLINTMPAMTPPPPPKELALALAYTQSVIAYGWVWFIPSALHLSASFNPMHLCLLMSSVLIQLQHCVHDRSVMHLIYCCIILKLNVAQLFVLVVCLFLSSLMIYILLQ